MGRRRGRGKRIAGDIGADGALYRAVEFTGQTIEDMSVSGRLTLCNMTIEMGGKNGIIVGTPTLTPILPQDIRAVRIWILSRADREDPDFRNTKTYVVGSQVITPNDGFRRRLLTTTVQCRNMGL